jgi:nicotinamide riboside kinase
MAYVERPPVKIAFIGTLSTGKTTLFEMLKHTFEGRQNIAFVNEAAREYLEIHPEDKEIAHVSLDIQKHLQMLIWEKEMQAHGNHPALIVCDRSVIDPAVYLAASGDRENAEVFFDRIKDWVKTYDWLFLLDPHTVPYVQDAIRVETPEERIRIHDTYVRFLHDHTVNYHALRGSLSENYTSVLEYLVRDLVDTTIEVPLPSLSSGE